MAEESPKFGFGLAQKSSFGPYIQRTPYREPSGLSISIAQRSTTRAPSGIVFSYHKKPQTPRVRFQSFGDGCNSYIIKEIETSETRTNTESDTDDSSSKNSESDHPDAAVYKSKWKFFRHICPNWK